MRRRGSKKGSLNALYSNKLHRQSSVMYVECVVCVVCVVCACVRAYWEGWASSLLLFGSCVTWKPSGAAGSASTSLSRNPKYLSISSLLGQICTHTPPSSPKHLFSPASTHPHTDAERVGVATSPEGLNKLCGDRREVCVCVCLYICACRGLGPGNRERGACWRKAKDNYGSAFVFTWANDSRSPGQN